MATEAHLDTLEAKGLIRPAAFDPELEYLFRHGLVQDAAYGSLLKQERRELHRLVGESLEALYPDRLAELAAILAIHFEQAGDTVKAADHHLVAGRYALERNAIREAYAAFDRVMALLPAAAAGEADALSRKRVEAAIGRSRAGFSFQSSGDVVVALEPVVPEAERLGDPELLAQIHLTLALARLQGGESETDPAVRSSLDRVAEIGRELDDPSLAALPIAFVGLNEVMGGPVRDGVAKLEAALPALEGRNDAIGAAFARGGLAMGYATLGDFERADEAARHASELAKDGDLIAQLDAVIAEAWVRAARGDLDEAVPLAQACVARAEETGATACVVASSWVLGDAYHRQGRFEEAGAVLKRGHDISLVVDRKVWRPTLQAWLGSTRVALGDDAGDTEWEEALATARSIRNRVGEAGILEKRAEAKARRGDRTAALTDFAASAAITEELEARPALARTLRGWGAALRAEGRATEGEERLRRALALFEEMGIEREAAEVRAELATPGV